MRTTNTIKTSVSDFIGENEDQIEGEEKLREIMHHINFFFLENIKCYFYIFMSRIIYYYDDLIQFEILRNQQENSVKHDFTNILIESYNFLRRFHIKKWYM